MAAPKQYASVSCLASASGGSALLSNASRSPLLPACKMQGNEFYAKSMAGQPEVPVPAPLPHAWTTDIVPAPWPNLVVSCGMRAAQQRRGR